jgi:hypothetical protein
LLPLLLVLAAVLMVLVVRRQASRPRSDQTYRPRAGGRGWSSGAQRGSPRANWVVPAAELKGLRDAYSSATIDPAQPLYRCGSCLAYYHEPSLVALREQNQGRCALCGSHDLGAVRVL